MISKAEFWIETGALAAALLLIPFYMGFIHVAPAGALVYVGIGGAGMATGEQLQFPSQGLPSAREFGSDVLLWSAAIAGVGGASYLLALVLV